ncbi:MAG: glycine cleavage system aminomethyltransferase GcvT [Hamadaea sp.]|uniref:glycine cleavage system aminomethyltransferase GcvT n=1 Tax=Hamadaea sp. TaxID=2024425 RepID=UPI0017E0E758|nr:glycine cleavage system aminomethyltransferase GcvT [Hamadaea sp.]NUR72871.1 glycine cleavage system aminomethyltransferase GcvT [Hamadaea sp.]NUT21014.1 glycine cleavage system aminomethyltransferase GcvT [Hamadaea sp.]
MSDVTSDAHQPLRRSPAHERHVALGAKFAPFGGWEMPLEYAGGGVLKEHTAVREAVGVFDVSHLGKARIAGPGAADFVNACLTNDLNRIKPGKAQYTLCCDNLTGGVVDDIIAYLFADDHVFLIPNAANTTEVVRRLTAAAPAGITVTNEHEDFAVFAVQGPKSADLLAALGLPTEHDYMSFETATLAVGDSLVELTVCRTGYTGEHGYELVVPAARAAEVWDAIFGTPIEARACGLAARDTLRTEMGYPLHGQDLSPEISPVEARSSWAVGWNKPEFWGRDVLLAEKEAGSVRTLRGLVATDRGIPRPHMSVYVGDDIVGEITSGTFSPTRKIGIALALIDAAAGLVEGDTVEVDIRGRRSIMTVTRPPFVTPSVR